MVSANNSRAALPNIGLRRCLALRNPFTGISAVTFMANQKEFF